MIDERGGRRRRDEEDRGARVGEKRAGSAEEGEGRKRENQRALKTTVYVKSSRHAFKSTPDTNMQIHHDKTLITLIVLGLNILLNVSS